VISWPRGQGLIDVMLASQTDSQAHPVEQAPNAPGAVYARRTRQLLIFITIVVAVLCALRLNGNFTYSDEADYYSIASNLLHHHEYSRDGIHPTAFRPPGYPAALVLVLAMRDTVRFAKTINLLWWIGAAVLTAHIARVLYGSVAESLALLLVLLYPVSLYTAGTLYPQALTTFLFLISIAVHFRSAGHSSWREALFQGLIFSFLILCVPLYAANLVVFAAFQTFREKKGFLKALLTCGVVAAALGFWGLRNYRAFGQFLFASNSGINLLLGNSPLTRPNSGTNVDVAAMAPEAANLPEIQRDAVLKQHAIDWMKDHPRAAAWLFAEKLANWFNYRNELATAAESTHLRDAVMALTYYPLLALALLLPLRRRGMSELESYLFLSYGSAALAYAFFFTRIRFRVPFDFLLVILASGSLALLLQSWRPRSVRRKAPAAASSR
jgi:hypothetical protein